MAEFRLLGPIQLWAAGQPVELGPPKQRTVLAALLVEAGRPVRPEVLVERVWDRPPPAEARNALYVHIMRIRRVLARTAVDDAPVRLSRQAGGYVVEIDPDQVDWHRFRRLVGEARAPTLDERSRADLLRQALGLWHGPPLADLTGEWVDRLRDGWQQQYLDAVVAWARIALRLGEHQPVIERVRDLVADHPLVEPLVAVLMRALHVAGRTSEALDCYASCRRHLADRLGADPGPELQQLHQSILRGELVTVPPAEPPVAAVPAVTPAQLPADVPGFTGRADELKQLDTILAATDRPGTAVTVAVISGTGGVGKTSLAVHWAHQVRDRFPDGQLYVNLRGFGPGEQAMSPSEAVRGFLDALSVPAARIPASVEAQANLYRTLLADRRMLILLDNARDAAQVRPLLPGAAGCLVLVTSRSRLPGLVAATGARPVPLDLLTSGESRELLARRLGPDRVAAEPAAVDEIITRCARLPLALSVVAARAATSPQSSLDRLNAELREAHGGLDALATDDPVTDLRSVFSWSYRQLDPDAAELFRWLGLHLGPDISLAAAASLAGAPRREVRARLAVLVRAHLVAEPAPGRYSLHDLLRLYAAELACRHDPRPRRQAALGRILDHYLHTADRALRLLDPHRPAATLPPARPGACPERLREPAEARAWCAAEYPVLVAAVRQGSAAGFDAETWQLACALGTILDRQGLWQEWADIQRVALASAERLAHPVGRADAHRHLAQAQARLGDYPRAHTHFQHALALYERLADDSGQADTHYSLGWVLGRQQRDAEALDHVQQALAGYQRAGNAARAARALGAVAWYHARLGAYDESLTCCRQALTMLQELGDMAGQASVWDTLGYAQRQLGDLPQAIECYQRSIDLYRQSAEQYSEAEVLTRLGDAHRDAGQTGPARRAWRQSLELLEVLGHPAAGRVRARLEQYPEMSRPAEPDRAPGPSHPRTS